MKRIWNIISTVIKVKDESWVSWGVWIVFLALLAWLTFPLPVWQFLLLAGLFRMYGHTRKADGEKYIVVKEFEKLNVTVSGKEADKKTEEILSKW